MPSMILYTVASLILFCLGLFGLSVHPCLVRKIMAMNIMAGGVFLFLISLAYAPNPENPDPVPQAMVLTGIVIAVSSTAFALFLIRHIQEKRERRDMDSSLKSID